MKKENSILNILTSVLIFWTIVGLILYSVYLFNNKTIPKPITKSETLQPQSIPKTAPKLINLSKLKDESDQCSTSASSKSYSYTAGNYSYLFNFIDIKAQFNAGYEMSRVTYANDFIDGLKPFYSDSGNVNNRPLS